MLKAFVLVFSFFFFMSIVYFIYSLIPADGIIIRDRLIRLGVGKRLRLEDEEIAKPFYVRVIQPMIKSMSNYLVKVTPSQIITGFENKITAAGAPFGFGVSEWLTIQALTALVMPAASIALGACFRTEINRIILVAAIEVLVGLLAPHIILSNQYQERQKEIVKTLPDILDLLTVSVEAGLGFDAALGKVIEKTSGVLSKEFERVLQEIKMGMPKKDALRSMSDRLRVIDFTTFSAAVIQADQLGVSIGKVLRIQSHQMRQKRRQRAQEKAMKAPVKMLIPMVMFIFPTIFTVILGPSVIKLINTFSK